MDALQKLHPGAVKGKGKDRSIPLDPYEWKINEERQDVAQTNM